MNGMAWRCDFPGERVQLPTVRRLATALLGDCPVRDDAISCVVELASNAILHTKSAGGVFTVGIWLFGTTARVAVKDAGGSNEPVLHEGHQGQLSEGGRGLAIVAALCIRLGVAGDEGGRVVRADLSCGSDGAGADAVGPVSREEVPLLEMACGRCWGLNSQQSRTVSPAVLGRR
ncbi:ATP-binding protein [Nonomuraea sp. B19D2]|uniref:ATP-binding protein n=1 Tax=Nonomuraea sp. B19D2 TaxID=3159561 RepID=UPI0032DB055B